MKLDSKLKQDVFHEYKTHEISLRELYKKYDINYGILHEILSEFGIKLVKEVYINFKKYYINGWRYSIYVQHNGNQYNFQFEANWNKFMHNLFIHELNTKRIYEK